MREHTHTLQCKISEGPYTLSKSESESEVHSLRRFKQSDKVLFSQRTCQCGVSVLKAIAKLLDFLLLEKIQPSGTLLMLFLKGTRFQVHFCQCEHT